MLNSFPFYSSGSEFIEDSIRKLLHCVIVLYKFLILK